MAKKKIGIYGQLESTPNHKVEDLYIVVEDHAIHFSVKHLVEDKYVAFESFMNNDANGWSPLLAYLQNNSKLMHAVYQNIHFVMNDPQVLITKTNEQKNTSFYSNELAMVFGQKQDQELMINELADQRSILYAIPDSLQTLLTRAFPTGKWSHYIQKLMATRLEEGIHLFAFEQFFITLFIQQNQVQFFHYFSEEGATQNVYQVLNICKQLSIPPAQTNIHLTGYNTNDHAWMEELVQYFLHATVHEAPHKGVIDTLNKEYPNHGYAPYFVF